LTSLSQKVLTSSLLLLSARMIQRGLGLVSTLVLARLLTPNDFGIVAIVSLTIALFEILSNTGSVLYITQKQDVSDHDLNTAWTIDILLKSTLWLFLIGATPYIADFYDNATLIDAFYVVSFVLILRAGANPGIILYRRTLEYKKLFWLTLIEKVVSFSVVITLVLVMPSFWAIIWGDLGAAMAMLVGSYFLHPFRPRLNLSKLREQWSFSQWILFKGLLGFFRSQIDTILVSKFFNPSDLGRYHLVRGVAILPSTDIILPAVQPLLAAFSQSKNNLAMLAYKVRLTLLVIVMTISPICFFMWNHPGPIVDVLLGSQWQNTYTLMTYFSILLFAFVFEQPLSDCFIALGRVKPLFYYDLFSVVGITGLLIIFPGESLEEFALRRGLLGVGFTSLFFIYTERLVNLSYGHTFSLLLPLLACAYLAEFALDFLPLPIFDNSLSTLITLTFFYFVAYGLLLLASYFIFYKRTEEGRQIKDLIGLNCHNLLGKINLHTRH
jgi:lipopolysaccharide exporter